MRFLAESMGSLPRAHTVRVLLKTDLRSAQAHIFDAAGVLDPVEGGILLRNQSDDLDWLARELARLPFPFEIRTPDALRDALRDCGSRLMQLAGAYGPG
jgi:predicted DNA-binding transcriptional regulator YafY